MFTTSFMNRYSPPKYYTFIFREYYKSVKGLCVATLKMPTWSEVKFKQYCIFQICLASSLLDFKIDTDIYNNTICSMH